ncbi:hypothetical protein CAPTEDRAFT_196531 [Capitella teleta]|uniref:Glycosyltransferase 2-like domain-containing protein n=1 Tax=Capitella teleta TaxID=283909 RepID=R7U654_CAPTE|nr:hypothetical protein CAPTEDRAFT_196531 [Capitella teleta]|eukprot:ELT98640.1 hypothetical protein CAPTEDRAFT_196531 [Capitella teleta]
MACLILFYIFHTSLFGEPHKISATVLRSNNAGSDPKANASATLACMVGVPCEYSDEVDFRVMVMTYDRPQSLEKCLSFLENIDTMGDTMRIEIWIDRSSEGEVNEETVKVAERFRLKGNDCGVHVRERNAGITGQWTDTWRPQLGTKEIGLIVEDDVDVSPLAYRWLKAAHKTYDKRSDIQGYTLQMQNVNFFGGKMRPMFAPKNETVYMYPVLGTWGFSPHPKTDLPTRWYKGFEKRHQEASMWEMWHIYYSYIKDLYCVYCNLKVHTGKGNVLLSWNRKEKGLHFDNKQVVKSTADLLSRWNDSFVVFPRKTIQFFYNGTIYRRA